MLKEQYHCSRIIHEIRYAKEILKCNSVSSGTKRPKIKRKHRRKQGHNLQFKPCIKYTVNTTTTKTMTSASNSTTFPCTTGIILITRALRIFCTKNYTRHLDQ